MLESQYRPDLIIDLFRKCFVFDDPVCDPRPEAGRYITGVRCGVASV